MSENQDFKIALLMAREMINAGVEQLGHYDPTKEDPALAVARIYAAMEMMRAAIEAKALADAVSPVDKKLLN